MQTGVDDEVSHVGIKEMFRVYESREGIPEEELDIITAKHTAEEVGILLPFLDSYFFSSGLCHCCYLPQPGWHTCHPLSASPGSCRRCRNWLQASSDDWHEEPTGGRQQSVFHCLPGRSLSKSVHITCPGSSGKSHQLALLLPVFHAGTISRWRSPAAEVSAPKQQH